MKSFFGGGNKISLPFIIGHRGAAAVAPENTLVGLHRAADDGARCVEFDVKLSADGVPFLLHDDTLNRTTNGRGPAARLSLSELKHLDAGTWFSSEYGGERIPTLSDVIQVLRERELSANVELKPNPDQAAETAQAVCRLLREEWPDSLPFPVLSSFDAVCLSSTLKSAPEFPRAMLWGKLPSSWKSVVANLHCDAVHLSDRGVTKDVVSLLNSDGLAVRVYTVNDPSRARQLREWGVQSVFTDCPDRIRDLSN